MNAERTRIMERDYDQKTENILRELYERMDTLYEEQTCRMRVIETVQMMLDRTA